MKGKQKHYCKPNKEISKDSKYFAIDNKLKDKLKDNYR